MYLDFFKLKQLPFRLTADPRFHFKDAARADAVKKLLAALGGSPSAQFEGCALVSGDAGVGKTTLVHDVLEQLPEQFIVVPIRQPDMSVAEFHEAIAVELGADAPGPQGSGTGVTMDACLERLAAQQRSVVLAVDNGELLAEPLLDEILRLPGRSRATAGMLRVILAARSSVENILVRPRGDGRVKQPALHFKLAPLTAQDTRGYVEHRLRVAGRPDGVLFRDDALAEIQRYTGGTPRLINTLADSALVAAYNRSHDTVTAVEVRGAANQLQWVEFDARAHEAETKGSIADEPTVGHIRIELENAVVTEFDLPLGKITLGRSANNDVRIDSRYVSRNHCQIVTTAQYSVIEDLQSQNGIAVGSRRVSVHRLHHGDQVKIGMHTLLYTRPRLLEAVRAYSFPLSLAAEAGEADIEKTGVILSLPNPPEGEGPKEH
jgi:general secretion pathway protein A